MNQPEESAAERINRSCFTLSREIAELSCSVPEAVPLARTLLRTVARIVIDTGAPSADPAGWPDTEEQALLWLNEALAPLGYEVQPTPDGGRPALADPSSEWQ